MSDDAYQLKFELDLPEEESSGAGALSVQEIQMREDAARRLFENGESWQKDEHGKPLQPYYLPFYEKMRAQGYPFRVCILVMWLATPTKYRYPKTQEELAESIGLRSPRQFSVWRAKNPMLDRLIEEAWRGPAIERLGDTMEAMMTVAAIPDYKGKGDRELHLKVAKVLSDKIEINDNRYVDLSEMSYREKLKLAKINNPDDVIAIREKFRKEQEQVEDYSEETGEDAATDS